MSIEDKDKIDAVGVNEEEKLVTLAITDHLDWENEYDHLIMLQEKINLYLSFLESGKIYESCPSAKDKKIEIKLFSKYDLTEKAEEFLNVAYAQIVEAGFNLSCEISGE